MESKKVEMTPAVIIGAYSVDHKRNYQQGMSKIKYLNVPKKIDFDLNKGEYEDKGNLKATERIDQLTSFIMDNRPETIREKRVDADFVCFRGVLRYVMESAENESLQWILDAVKFKGTVYMCLAPSADSSYVETEQDKMNRRAGFKFESYILSDHPQSEPKGSDTPVIEAEEFCVVMSRSIGGRKIIFGNEIDGVSSDSVVNTTEGLRKASLVEVKTRKGGVGNLNKFKVLNWYCQAVVSDTYRIHVGNRNDDDFIVAVDAIDVKETITRGSDKWGRRFNVDTDKCFKFLKDFLYKVNDDMKDVDDPLKVFRYTSNSDIRKISFTSYNVKPDGFVPDRFVEFMNNL